MSELVNRMRQTVMDDARAVGALFDKPDDDWTPKAFLQTQQRFIVVDLTGIRDKDRIRPALVELFRQQLPDCAAVLFSTWTLIVPREDPLADLALQMCGDFGVQNHPERQEGLHLTIADKDGNQEGWHCRFTRHETQPPTLGEWQKMDGDSPGGRFYNLLPDCFRLCAKARTRREGRR